MPPGMPPQSEPVQRRKDGVHADKREPEMDFAEALAQVASEHFRRPEIGGGENAEDGRDAHNQVEMGDDEIGVVEEQVNRGLCQKQTGNPAGNKQGNESNGKEHRAGELNLPAPERAQPVERLDV